MALFFFKKVYIESQYSDLCTLSMYTLCGLSRDERYFM